MVTADGYGVLSNTGGNITIPPGVESFSISPNGEVITVQDGTPTPVGTIGIAIFNNPEGLESVGGNLFQATNNSGTANLGVANQNGRGTVASGKLEMSNVDLGEEFTEMIVAQRGFQANTRIITTSDEILQELVNLKR